MGEIYKDDIFLGGIVEDVPEDVKARAARIIAEQEPKKESRKLSRPSDLRRKGFRPPTPEEKTIGITHWVCRRHPILWIPGKGIFRPHRRNKEVPFSAVQVSGTPGCRRCEEWKPWGGNRARKERT